MDVQPQTPSPDKAKAQREASPVLVSVILAAGFLALYLGSLARVPFHPDESSWLLMSRDFETLFLRLRPTELAWAPGQPLTPEISLRLLNAPVGKYLIGLGWWLAGYSTADLNSADWVWGASWADNEAARPREEVLLASRVPAAILGALTGVLLFWVGRRLGGFWVGLAAALLMAFDPLTYLHTRRAMAEGGLLFFSVLAAWACLRLAQACDERQPAPGRLLPWAALAGALAGLAFCAKQTALTLPALAFLAPVLPLWLREGPRRGRLKAMLITWGAALACAGLVFWLGNPVLGSHPLATAWKMIELRAQLAQEQARVNDPAQVLPGALDRLRAAAASVYFDRPALMDAPVYVEELAPAASAYMALPLNRLWAQPWAGILLAGLGAVGAASSARRIVRTRFSAATRAEQALWLWLLLALGLTLLTIPLDWQRYFLPLLPCACLLAALGLDALARLAKKAVMYNRRINLGRG
jgi:4-amino-4-deoxy-L-arabinose transferase-like glycosyltransferase